MVFTHHIGDSASIRPVGDGSVDGHEPDARRTLRRRGTDDPAGAGVRTARAERERTPVVLAADGGPKARAGAIRRAGAGVPQFRGAVYGVSGMALRTGDPLRRNRKRGR